MPYRSEASIQVIEQLQSIKMDMTVVDEVDYYMSVISVHAPTEDKHWAINIKE